MGISIGKRCFTNSFACAPNPSPSRYKVIFREKYANCTLLGVNYIGCTNFEGNKILVFLGDFNPSGDLDPHFSDSESSPIARFKPDQIGLSAARFFCGSL